MRSLVIVALVAGLLATSPIASHAAANAVSCRSYREAMETARDALRRGEQGQALVALRKAKVALAECHREEAGITSLLAAGTTPTRS
jgi:hypothetical protein